MKIYTKTGDDGETSLFSGKRVPKTHDLIDSFGLLDELNTAVGALICSLKKEKKEGLVLGSSLPSSQSYIFSIGSFLASEFTQVKHVENVASWTLDLEKEMDQMSEALPELKNFILPGGAESACRAHMCRVLARNAERQVVGIGEVVKCKSVLIYLNRLSDYFFVLARFVNFNLSVEEPVWRS